MDEKEVSLIPHGTWNGYINYGCRCGSCRDASNKYAKARRQADLEGSRKSARKRMAEVRGRASALKRKLKDVPCKDCGIKYPSYVMTFDHLHSKLFDMARLQSIPNILSEFEKCEVVCANCHAERTHQRKIAKHTTK